MSSVTRDSAFSMKNLFKQHREQNASHFTINNLFKASIDEPDDKSSQIANKLGSHIIDFKQQVKAFENFNEEFIHSINETLSEIDDGYIDESDVKTCCIY